MTGYIITAIVAASLVAAYIVVVNHFLRQDEHYDEQH